MCLDCYPDRCFTYACKNASHCTAVSVPDWCCTVRRDSRSNRASCPVLTAVLCSCLGARRCFPYSSSLFSLSVTHHLAHASRRRTTGELWLCSTPPPPIPHLSPPFLHLTVLVMTTHLFYPDPTLIPFSYFLSSSSFCSSFGPFPPSSITTPMLSLPLRRDQCRIVLCCDIESCIH